jgi:hypothetical protein
MGAGEKGESNHCINMVKAKTPYLNLKKAFLTSLNHE